MPKKITVSLSAQSIDNAIKELKAYKSELEKKLDELCKRLADYGVDIIANDYGYTDTGEIAVGWYKVDKGYVVTAEGRGVYFVEFGAGDLAGTGMMKNPPVATTPGSYSEQHAQEYTQYGYWYWNGHVFNEIAPRSGVYYASEFMRRDLINIAKEVFTNA